MKTTIKKKDRISSILRLTKVLMIVAFISLGLKTNAQCVANFTFSANPANNGEVIFTNTSTGGTDVYYNWSFGDGGYAYATESPIYVFDSTGTYSVSLVMSDSLSMLCSDTVNYTISIVNNTPACHAYFTNIDSLGDTYFIDQSSGSGLIYSWDFGDGNTSTTTGSVIHHYATTGMRMACVTVTNAAGTCTDTYCDTLIITSCHADFSFTPDAAGFGGTFTSTTSGTADTFSWGFGDGTSSNAANPHHIFSTSGTYLVQLVVSSSTDSTCSDIHYEYVTITGNCNASFTFVQDSTDFFHYYVYNNSTNSPSTNYLWDFGDGTTSTSAYPIHTYAGTGPYFLCLTVTTDTTCTSTYCDSLYAGRSSGTLSITVVNPLTTGIDKADAVNAILENYPNPFNGSTTINYSILKDAAIELTVVDLLGNKVASLENNQRSAGNYSVVWNAENVAKGMYLLQMKADNKIITKKIIIQ